MDIRFKCDCGQTLKVGEEASGKVSKCPSCGKKIRIPTVEEAQPQPIRVASVLTDPRLESAIAKRKSPFVSLFVKRHPFIVWLLALFVLFLTTLAILHICMVPDPIKKAEDWHLPALLGLTTLFVFDYLYSRMIKRLQVKAGEE